MLFVTADHLFTLGEVTFCPISSGLILNRRIYFDLETNRLIDIPSEFHSYPVGCFGGFIGYIDTYPYADHLDIVLTGERLKITGDIRLIYADGLFGFGVLNEESFFGVCPETIRNRRFYIPRSPDELCRHLSSMSFVYHEGCFFGLDVTYFVDSAVLTVYKFDFNSYEEYSLYREIDLAYYACFPDMYHMVTRHYFSPPFLYRFDRSRTGNVLWVYNLEDDTVFVSPILDDVLKFVKLNNPITLHYSAYDLVYVAFNDIFIDKDGTYLSLKFDDSRLVIHRSKHPGVLSLGLPLKEVGSVLLSRAV